MIFLITITIIFLLYYRKYCKETNDSPLLIFFVSIVFLSLFSLECSLRGIGFFASDELFYINSALDNLLPDLNRFLWYFINNLIINYDISFNGVALKLINIPIAASFLMVLWLIFKDKKVFLISVILPYFAFIATKNLRDIPIFLFTALTILLFHHRKPIYMVLSLISLGMLFLLRPFAAIITFIILLLQIFLLIIKSLKRLAISKRVSQKIVILIIIGVIISPFVVPVVRSFIVKSYSWFTYTTFEEGYKMRLERRTLNDFRFSTGNKSLDFCVASVRYVVTPMPTSLLGRFMKGGSNQWGLVDDLIRLVHQIGYYFLLGYLGLNFRNIWLVFRQMSAAGRAFILCFLTYWPIYSFYLYGVSHQRLKLPLQIAVFLIAMCVSAYKKKRGYLLNAK